jgi:hypothetical protein
MCWLEKQPRKQIKLLTALKNPQSGPMTSLWGFRGMNSTPNRKFFPINQNKQKWR